MSRRRLTFAAAGAFSMMAMAVSTAFLTGAQAGGSAGRPAGPAVERNLVEQAGTLSSDSRTEPAPVTLAAPVSRQFAVSAAPSRSGLVGATAGARR